MKMTRYSKALVLVVIVVGTAFVYSWQYHLGAHDTYAKEILDTYGAQEVAVGEKQFIVTSDAIEALDDTSITTKEKERATQTAILLAEARHAPLLSLAGTDPSQLRKRVEELEDATTNTARMQELVSDARSIETGLYPIDFLFALADLEEARLSFTQAKTEVSASVYEQSLFRALQTGEENIISFAEALDTIMAQDRNIPQLYSLTGTITNDSFLTAVTDIQKRMAEAKDVAQKRRSCREGKGSDCTRDALLFFPSIQDANTEGAKHASEPFSHTAAIQNHKQFLGKVATRINNAIKGGQDPVSHLTIQKSICLRELEGPHHYVTFGSERKSTLTKHYAGSLFFQDTSQADGPVLNYLNDQNVGYVVVRPLLFYTCPEAQKDLGLLSALIKTADAAEKHPSVATREREALFATRGHISDVAARAYIHAARTEVTRDMVTKQAFDELALMLSDSTADFDMLIETITNVLEARSQQHKDNLPYDVSAKNLFFTHSAFPSLFLTFHPRAGITPILLVEHIPKNHERFLEVHKSYDELIVEKSEDDLVQDVVQLHFQDNPR